MRSSNPVLTGRGFARIKESTSQVQDLNTLESRPTSAPMSIDDVVIKTAGLFAVLVAVGAFAWRANSPGLALIGFIGGFILAFPYIFWEFWRFVRPALSDKELKKTRGIIVWVSLLFFTGVAFGYFILTPFMVNFYFNYKLSAQIVIMPSFSDYLENLIYTTAGIGVLFQMPLLVMLLARIGVVTATFLRTYRRHAFVIILIAAAIITPSTDPFSLTIVTIPLYLLFEASIILAGRVNKEQKKEWS